MKSNCLLLMLCLPIIILLSGCSVPGIAPQIDIPPSLMQKSQLAAQEVQDCHLRVGLEFTNTLLEDKQILEIWYARPTSMRLEILESTQPSFQDIISAFDGTTGWTYRGSANLVDTGPIDAVKPAIVYDMVHSALDLFWGPPSIEVYDIAADYVNREWVYRLSGKTDQAECTLWLQTDSLLPVKLYCRSQKLGQYTMTINQAEYDLGLTEELFDLSLLPTEVYTVRSLD